MAEDAAPAATAAALSRAPAPPTAAFLAFAVLAAAAAGLGGIGGCAAPAYLKETPRPFAFRAVREAVPGALVVSETVRLQGLLGRRPIVAYAGGDAAELVVNGRPVGATRAFVREGDKIALAVRAPEAPGGIAVGTVEVGNGRAEFQVAAAKRPARGLRGLGETAAAPGRLAVSPVVVAPADLAPGSRLTARGDGAGRVQAETRRGRVDLPAALGPGEPFRLVTRLPEGREEPLRLRVRLGALDGAWTVRPAAAAREQRRRAEAGPPPRPGTE